MNGHFQEKDVYEHLKDARQRGAKATAETHGTEAPGYVAAAADSAKETAILLFGFWTILAALKIPSSFTVLAIFSCGWILWKMGRSSLLGSNRLERLHRLIEEERWEIEHHRAQEKEELRAMYAQKGLSGSLLDQTVEVLMADDNRLLRVMLEEELGLTLESYEHPLKQAMGAGAGAVASIIFGLIGLKVGGCIGIASSLSLIFGGASVAMAVREGNQPVKALIWNFAVGVLSIATIYFISEWIT